MELKLKTNRNKKSQVLLFKKYSLLQNIGGGAFGTVFLGENIFTKEKFAIKVEERNKARTTLEREAFILYYLKGPGLPDVKSFGKTKKYNILIQTLLGRSLYQIFNDCFKKFTIKDVCMIGLQILERLEYIHSKNYIHRDIKPHNFLVSPKNEGIIYIIDFGLAKKYKSERGNHVKFAITKHITGTPRFCSINAMRGVEQSRRDDLESLSYLILYFLNGSLPWQGLKIASRIKRFNTITNKKKTIKLESLCENLPPEILLFCKYTRKLGFTENPKYNYMKSLFLSILNKYGLKDDKKFSWIQEGTNIGNYNFINFHFHKKSPHKRLFQKIRSSLEKKQKEKVKENNDYTLNTIYIENNNIHEINENNNTINNIVQNKNYIQSNDNNVLQNNIIQLNIDNFKHSYNYPLVIYNKNNLDKKENDFDKIAQNFQSNDTNILQQNPINIPDKISVIDATQSNLANIQISHNQLILISEKNKKALMNQNKGMKIHDYIRQEEKDGGVIGKDFDFKENEYFKIATPLFKSELKESSEIESNININNDIVNSDSLTNIKRNNESLSIDNNKLNKKIENKIIENISYNKLNNSCNYKKNSNRKIIKENNTDKIELNKSIKKENHDNSHSIVSLQDINTESNKINKLINSHNIPPKFNSFFIKKASIDLNNELIEPNNSSLNNHNSSRLVDNISKEKNKYNSRKKTAANGVNYINTNGNKHILPNNLNQKDKHFQNVIKNNNNYQNKITKVNNISRPMNINRNNFNKPKKINNNHVVTNHKIIKKKLKIDIDPNNNNRIMTQAYDYNNINKKNKIISTNNTYKSKMTNTTESNYINDNYIKNQLNNIEKQLKLKDINNKNLKNIDNSYRIKMSNGSYDYSNINNSYDINNSINNNNYNILISKSLNAKSYKKINPNNKPNNNNTNNNNNKNIIHINNMQNEKNKNIIINNLIIKNNCNNLLYRSNLSDDEHKNQKQTYNNRYNDISQMSRKNNSYLYYKPISDRNNFNNYNNISN